MHAVAVGKQDVREKHRRAEGGGLGMSMAGMVGECRRLGQPIKLAYAYKSNQRNVQPNEAWNVATVYVYTMFWGHDRGFRYSGNRCLCLDKCVCVCMFCKQSTL